MANLTQLKMLEDLDGFLLVDKPAGIAFSSVVKAVKRKFNLVKVGHGGSLDSAASGLFILLINDANKFVGDVMGADRAYEGVMRLGLKTNTHDVQGETLAACELEPVMAELSGRIAAALPEFKGDIFQTESRWCSVRREGSAAYEVVDTGEHKPFMAHVYKLSFGEIDGARLTFSVSGTKGLIVRTLVNDFGEAIGCGAALESLRRVRIGKFPVDSAIPFDKLLDTDIKDFASCVMPLGEALR
ncbi:MAG: tRNA pseudouridine(55) synthase TruB [Kiritimatiellae bacterium]|nr:tRNA pseudouridine(55) synthase TruB [Kiritimatiellia bacterium]